MATTPLLPCSSARATYEPGKVAKRMREAANCAMLCCPNGTATLPLRHSSTQVEGIWSTCSMSCGARSPFHLVVDVALGQGQVGQCLRQCEWCEHQASLAAMAASAAAGSAPAAAGTLETSSCNARATVSGRSHALKCPQSSISVITTVVFTMRSARGLITAGALDG